MTSNLFLAIFVVCLVTASAFRTVPVRHPVRGATTLCSQTEDPNYMAHLPTLLRKGLDERPDTDLARELRQKYKFVEHKKRTAAGELKEINPELAVELEVSKKLDHVSYGYGLFLSTHVLLMVHLSFL